MFLSLRIYAVISLLFCGLTSLAPRAHAAGPELKINAFTFVSESAWMGSQTTLARNNAGRWRTLSGQTALTAGCEDLLQGLQKQPIEEMVRRGHINRAVAQDLYALFGMESSSSRPKISPARVLFLTLFSDLTKSEALAIFGAKANGEPNIPEDRLISHPQGDGPEPLIRVYRGALYATRGWQLEPAANRQGFQLSPRPLPWELDPSPPSGLSRFPNRERLPLRIEIGRAFMGRSGEPLPGEFASATEVILRLLSNEAQALGQDPDQVLVTAHTVRGEDDRQSGTRARLFMRANPLRVLTQARLEQIEANPQEGLRGYLEEPIPREPPAEAILYGSLGEANRRYPLAATSERVRFIQEWAPNLSPEEASALALSIISAPRDQISMQVAGLRAARGPLMLYHWRTPILLQRYRARFRRFNVELSLAQAIAYEPRMSEIYPLTEADLFLDNWVEQRFFIPGSNESLARSGGAPTPATIVANLDAQLPLSVQDRFLYLISVLKTASDSIYLWLRNLGQQDERFVLEYVNQVRKNLGLTPVNVVTEENYLETFPIMVGTGNADLRATLNAMGGREFSGLSFMVDFVAGPLELPTDRQAALRFQDETLYRFGPREITAIRRQAESLNLPTQPVQSTQQNYWRIRVEALQAVLNP